MIQIEHYIYGILENLLKPMLSDILKVLERFQELGIKKEDVSTFVDRVLKLETRRIIINAILYLLMTIIICYTVRCL